MLVFAGVKYYNHKSSGLWDDLKLCPDGMDVLNEYEATPRNPKTGKTVGGEKQFGIKRDGAFFFYNYKDNIVPSFFVYTKEDLLAYLDSSEFEYKHPSIDYCNKKFLPEMYEVKKKAVQMLDDRVLLNFYINLRCDDDGSADAQYLMPYDAASRNSYYDFLKILLSNSTQGKKRAFTRCAFFKFVNVYSGEVYIYMKPEFIKEYTMEELAVIFSKELEGKTIDDCLQGYSSQFAFKYMNQIMSEADVNALLDSVSLLSETQKDCAKKEFLKIVNSKEKFLKKAIDDAKKTIKSFVKKDDEKPLYQKIFFGAPGTGKSYKIDHGLTRNGGLKDWNLQENQVWRTTFHPDYEFVRFVGCYKPTPKENNLSQVYIAEDAHCSHQLRAFADVGKASFIGYAFDPQIFAKAYAAAWKFFLDNSEEPENVFLVIDEINRGNCAQIFGDLFQLLDRNAEGFSQFSINADAEFGKWLKNDSELKDCVLWKKYKVIVNQVRGVCDDSDIVQLVLPPNFNILATMNTSDQSLFPMDSAFKRRFDWEYVPITYSNPFDKDGESELHQKWPADKYVLDKGICGAEIRWLHFLKKVNEDIYTLTNCEDKQMGEFFVKPKDGVHIGEEEFCSKVLFYLWDSVYKDYDASENPAMFHFDCEYSVGDSKNVAKNVSFQQLYGNKIRCQTIIKQMMKNLDQKYSAAEFGGNLLSE